MRMYRVRDEDKARETPRQKARTAMPERDLEWPGKRRRSGLWLEEEGSVSWLCEEAVAAMEERRGCSNEEGEEFHPVDLMGCDMFEDGN